MEENTMKCNKCGFELKIYSKEHGMIINNRPTFANFVCCDNCKTETLLSDYLKENADNSAKQKSIKKLFMYDKFYLSTWVIALCFTFSYFIIPFIVGVCLLIRQTAENMEYKKRYGQWEEIHNSIILKELELASRTSEAERKEKEIQKLTSEISDYQNTISNLKDDLISEEVQAIANSLDYSSYDSYSSEECKNELALLQQDEKELIKAGTAIQVNSNQGKKQVNDNSKQILRCFNAECDNIVLSISVRNIDSLRSKLTKCYDTLNKIFEVDGVSLSKQLLEYKLKELTLLYTFEVKRKQELELQKAIKEQMLEEERVRRELEKRKKEIEKDQKQFSNEVSKLMKYLQKTDNDIEKQLYADKIKELEERIKTLESEKADVINREQNAKAGFVYIISNIGSFGENIFKIGMTRRLEPMDRIKELSSASVPFEFDVHAMIFSEDAPALESSLHQHFDNYRVNKINPRKEFFNVSIDEIEEYVTANYNDTVEFTKIPIAKEYRDTQALYEGENNDSQI